MNVDRSDVALLTGALFIIAGVTQMHVALGCVVAGLILWAAAWLEARAGTATRRRK